MRIFHFNFQLSEMSPEATYKLTENTSINCTTSEFAYFKLQVYELHRLIFGVINVAWL